MICCNTITRRRPDNVKLNNERGAAVFWHQHIMWGAENTLVDLSDWCRQCAEATCNWTNTTELSSERFWTRKKKTDETGNAHRFANHFTNSQSEHEQEVRQDVAGQPSRAGAAVSALNNYLGRAVVAGGLSKIYASRACWNLNGRRAVRSQAIEISRVLFVLLLARKKIVEMDQF